VELPEVIPLDMIVAVTPTHDSSDLYWIAQVVDIDDQEIRGKRRVKYTLRYYKYNPKTKSWKLSQGPGYRGDCNHEAILLAGVNFTQSGVITAACVRQIMYALKNN
jgi:hypothetical protein